MMLSSLHWNKMTYLAIYLRSDRTCNIIEKNEYNGQAFSRVNVTAAVQQVIYCVKNYLLCKERPIDKSLTY